MGKKGTGKVLKPKKEKPKPAASIKKQKGSKKK